MAEVVAKIRHDAETRNLLATLLVHMHCSAIQGIYREHSHLEQRMGRVAAAFQRLLKSLPSACTAEPRDDPAADNGEIPHQFDALDVIR